MKKIDFFNSAKLLTMTIGLILGAFVMLSMAFPEDGSGISDNSSEYAEGYPNDSTNNSGPKPRKSHYYQQASCGGTDTKHGATDYAKAVAITTGGGTVTLSDGEGGGVVTNTGSTSGSENGNSVTFEWNCGSTANQKDASATEDMHKHKVVFSATADDNHSFVGWSKTSSEDDIVSKESPYTEEMFIDDWNQNNGSHETAEKALTLTYYAIFKEKVMATITLAATEGGSYTYTCTDGNGVVSTQQQSITTQNAITFTAKPFDGYKFFGWYTMNGDHEEYFSYSSTLEKAFFANTTIYAKFIPKDWALFSLKDGDGTLFYDLNKAIAVATKGSTIVVAIDGTLPAGNYTIPQGVTLLIPFNAANTCYTTEPFAGHGHYNIDGNGNYSTPISSSNYYDPSNRDYSTDRSTLYRMLTLAEGVNLTIEGTLSISADRWGVYDTGSHGTSKPNLSGNFRIDQGYGMINMNEGSVINVGNATNKPEAKLYCWGRIRGEGEIFVEEKAEVHESIVFTDFRETDSLGYYAQSTKCFPFTQYYIQDIQVPISFNYGAKEILRTGLFGTKKNPIYQGTMQLVGSDENSLIKIPEGGKFKKSYNIPTDRLILDLYDGTSFHSAQLAVSVSGVSFGNVKAPTNTHIFPITNNWTINFHPSATPYEIHYDLDICAGAELNIEEGAHLKLTEGASLYVYDREEWKEFPSIGNDIIPLFLPEYERNHNTYDGITLYNITPKTTYKAIRRSEDLQDAAIKVNGTFTIFGGENTIYKGSTYGKAITPRSNSGLYTTASGANIYSEGNGQIIYLKGSGDQNKVPQTYKSGKTVKWINISPAQLKNADDSYTATTGASGMSTFKYFSENGEWKQAWKVTFMNEGEEFSSAYYAQGDEIIPPTEQPQKEGHRFKGWGDVAATMGTEDLEYEAQWEQIVVVTTIEITPTTVFKDNDEAPIDESTYVINKQMQAEVVKVDEGAAIEIAENVSVETQTLALSTTPSAIDAEQGKVGSSSQIKGNGTITAQNIFIDITMDPSGTLDASKYYAFAVPFAVNVDGGVQQLKNNEWEACIHNTHYRAYTYDGANRAINGKGSNWTLVNTPTFYPGIFYLVEFAPGMGNVYRFTKAGESQLNNAADINLEAFASANTADKGWNGIANNALQNVKISLSNTGVAQVFDPAKNEFVTVSLVNTQFAIGTPLFVQTDGAGTATNSAVAQPASIPARMLAQPQTETLGNYTVRIAAENADKMADQLFISASEDAENNYVIGKDLVKMFMGNATTAQLWVNNYDKKLSMHQALLTNGSAEAPLTLYAPKAGDYKVYLTDIPEDANLYLLENGEVIANLNDGAYSVTLTKGENTRYGLRINARTKIDVTTSINETIATQCVKKILLQGNVYIVRDGKLFNTLGQFVK